MDLTTATTHELLEALRSCDLDVPPGLPEELIRRREESVRPLCDLLQTEINEGWGAIHALHILGALGDARTVPVIVEILQLDSDADGDILGDWLTEEMSSIIARMPGDGVAAFVDLLEDTCLGTFHRGAVADGLFGIATRHPEHRQRLVDLFQRLIDADDDNYLTTVLIALLARMGHEDPHGLYDKQERLGRIDAFSLAKQDLDWILQHQAPWTVDRHDRDPLRHFTPANLKHLREVQASYERADGEFQEDAEDLPDDGFPDRGFDAYRPWPEPRRVVKIGRNDPCPCGSGRKYKKCCLGTDQDPARQRLADG